MASAKKHSGLAPFRKLNTPRALVFGGLTAAVGVVLVLRIFAATTPTAFEPESGTLVSPAKAVAVTGASGGSILQFGAAATPTPTAAPTPTPSGGACAAGEIGTPPNCFPTPPGPLASGKQWKMLFNDEFNGTTLNTANFSPCFDWNYGGCTDSFNTGREHYDPGQVRLSNGTAKLVAEPLSPTISSGGCYNGTCNYKAGLISTSRPNANGGAYLHPFTYGYIESRMKYPAVKGMFTAFWMLPTDPTFSYRSEIDIVEILGGDPKTIFMTYHYNNRSQSASMNNGDLNNGACAVKDYSLDFVRFGMDWEPTYVAWYIDGVKCGQFNGNATTIENGPMQIILHMMVDNQWERDWGLTLANQSVISQLEVDYLRVYQQQ
jgi:beta-glucanase (GH16 family)